MEVIRQCQDFQSVGWLLKWGSNYNSVGLFLRSKELVGAVLYLFFLPISSLLSLWQQKPVTQLQGKRKGEHAPAERGEVTQPVGSKKGKMMFTREREENKKPQCLFFPWDSSIIYYYYTGCLTKILVITVIWNKIKSKKTKVRDNGLNFLSSYYECCHLTSELTLIKLPSDLWTYNEKRSHLRHQL